MLRWHLTLPPHPFVFHETYIPKAVFHPPPRELISQKLPSVNLSYQRKETLTTCMCETDILLCNNSTLFFLIQITLPGVVLFTIITDDWKNWVIDVRTIRNKMGLHESIYCITRKASYTSYTGS